MNVAHSTRQEQLQTNVVKNNPGKENTMKEKEGTKIYRSSGTEGTCPICFGGNAMLSGNNWDGHKTTSFVRCRDCGFTVIDPEIIEVQYGELITRYKNGKDNQEVDLLVLQHKILKAKKRVNLLQAAYKKETGKNFNG